MPGKVRINRVPRVMYVLELIHYALKRIEDIESHVCTSTSIYRALIKLELPAQKEPFVSSEPPPLTKCFQPL